MTESEKNVLRSLVAVAWADGQIAEGETGVIDGLLSGFDASEEEEAEILAYARIPRTLEADIPVAVLSREDRELLLSNAALLTHADGEQSDEERQLLDRLARILKLDPEDARAIISSASDGIGRLARAPESG